MVEAHVEAVRRSHAVPVGFLPPNFGQGMQINLGTHTHGGQLATSPTSTDFYVPRTRTPGLGPGAAHHATTGGQSVSRQHTAAGQTPQPGVLANDSHPSAYIYAPEPLGASRTAPRHTARPAALAEATPVAAGGRGSAGVGVGAMPAEAAGVGTLSATGTQGTINPMEEHNSSSGADLALSSQYSAATGTERTSYVVVMACRVHVSGVTASRLGSAAL